MYPAHLLALALGISSSLPLGISAFRTGSPSPPGLTFQSDPRQIPALSFESWSDAQNTVAGTDDTGDRRDRNYFDNEGETQVPELSQPNSGLLDDLEDAFSKKDRVFTTLKNIFESLAASVPFSRPPLLGNEPINLRKYTIWQVLEQVLRNSRKSSFEERNRLPLYRLAWVANLSEPIKEILSNPNADLTFFAPDDQALTPPHKKKGGLFDGTPLPGLGNLLNEQQEAPVGGESETHPFWEALEHLRSSEGCHMAESQIEEDGSPDKEKKRRVLLHIIETVLRYHISPGKKTFSQLLESSTIPTDLKISSQSSSPKFRIKVGAPHPGLSKPGELALNFFTKIGGLTSRPIITKNGVIHIAHHAPLLPPLSPLSQLFLFPRPFSTLTSAVQKVHLDKVLLPHVGDKVVPFDSENPEAVANPVDGILGDEGLDEVDERVKAILSTLVEDKKPELHKRSFTVFAPTNRAFRSLGPHLNAFLFSPFGGHVLRYVLSYHIVPDIIWYSDHVDNVTDIKEVMERYESDVELPEEFAELSEAGEAFHPHFAVPGAPKFNVTKYALPTLLGSRKNETLKVAVVESRLPTPGGRGPIVRRVYIKPGSQPPKKSSGKAPKGTIKVPLPDEVAWGGAIHVIDKVIAPPVPAGHESGKGVRRALEILASSQLHDEV